MKTFLVLLLCSSLVFAKLNIDGPKKNIITNFLIGDDKCDFCIQNYEELHESFQDPLTRYYILSVLKSECPDEECYKKAKAFVKAVTSETDPKKGCKILCEEPSKN